MVLGYAVDVDVDVEVGVAPWRTTRMRRYVTKFAHANSRVSERELDSFSGAE